MKKLFVIFLIIFTGCGIEDVVQYDYLNPPSDLKAYPKNRKIKVLFYSSNREEKFSGFNLYISRSSSLKSQANLLPVKNPKTGGLPTIPLTASEIDPDSPVSVEIEYDANDNPIENGITYFLIVKACNIRGLESQPSNETSTTPRIENTNGVILYTNEGFNLKTQTKNTPYNFIFSVKSNPAKKGYIIAKNNTLIQSKGYYDNWEKLNKADETGYIQSDIPLEIENGYLIIFKTPEQNYAKIWIKELKLDTSIPYVKFYWAYQTLSGNTDI